MSEPKWTPGPWFIDTAPRMASLSVRAAGRPIASIWCREGGGFRVTKESQFEGEANARLIAAAPELYEALEAFRPFFEGDDHPKCKQMRAALAKASGETP